MGSFQRYLRAKRSVDDRSLDRRLVGRLRDGLEDRAAARSGPLRVLEVGAGVGTMVGRLWEWELLPEGAVEYAAVDVRETNVRAIPDRLVDWAAGRAVDASLADDAVVLAGDERTVTVSPVAAEAARFVAASDREWDLLVGMALLDVVGLDRLPRLVSAVSAGGYWYFPITFDGGTRFVPDHPADEDVERAYHRHMDEKPGGDSRAGSHALDRLQSMDGTVVEGAAGSDWIVSPADGTYPAEERYFLSHVLDTVEGALGELDGHGLGNRLDDWLATRRRQVEAAELTYLTHQLDLLGRVEEPAAVPAARTSRE
jgi:hypothetical protein